MSVTTAAVALLSRYLGNVKKDVANPKYRKIRIANDVRPPARPLSWALFDPATEKAPGLGLVRRHGTIEGGHKRPSAL